VDRLFLTVTVLAALVVPTVWLAYVRVAGVTDTGTTPVPVSVTLCGLFVAPSVMLAVAVSALVVDGVNVKLILHEPWPLTLAPHVVPDSAKSLAFAPPIVTVEIVTGALVLLVSVTVFAALVVPLA